MQWSSTFESAEAKGILVGSMKESSRQVNAAVEPAASQDGLPIGVCLRTIRAQPSWWLEVPGAWMRQAMPECGPGTTSSAVATRPFRS